ncbi:MAG TPA: hypothetical protein VFB43_10385 [Terracidiphilus sp.]|nr:hypothetical protein [Terracidiphilus sp.]
MGMKTSSNTLPAPALGLILSHRLHSSEEAGKTSLKSEASGEEFEKPSSLPFALGFGSIYCARKRVEHFSLALLATAKHRSRRIFYMGDAAKFVRWKTRHMVLPLSRSKMGRAAIRGL